MTAQDIDLKKFSDDDLKKLRENIDSSIGKPTAVKVCIFINSTEGHNIFFILNRIVLVHF
jgi:hypothetical protein